MPIWDKPIDLDAITAATRGTLDEALGIRITGYGEDWLRGTLPVDARTRQPFGLLHGGASVALAESLGSLAGWLTLPPGSGRCVGTSLSAHHLRMVRDGVVTGTARPLHLGRSSQVWDIHVEDAPGRVTCVVRLGLAILLGGND